MKISNKSSIWTIWLVVVVIASIAATYAYGKISESQMLQAQLVSQTAPIVYGADGKENGQPLSADPVHISDDYIFYEDRVLERFFYSQHDVEYTVAALNTTFDWVPQGVDKYLIVAPNRIAYEGQTTTNDDEYMAKAIGEITEGIEGDVNQVDVLTALREKTDEYIYFRTDRAWTALGAYYAAKEFLLSAGTDIIPIDEYYEYTSADYHGVYALVDGADVYDHPDTIYYYMLDGATNHQLITTVEDKGLYEYSCPTVALSRGGTKIFIEGYFASSLIDGDGDGKSIMIVGDYYSKIFTPWLVPYYQNIILINPAYYDGDKYILAEMIKQYNVEDFLVIQSTKMMGETVEGIRMTHIFETEE